MQFKKCYYNKNNIIIKRKIIYIYIIYNALEKYNRFNRYLIISIILFNFCYYCFRYK